MDVQGYSPTGVTVSAKQELAVYRWTGADAGRTDARRSDANARRTDARRTDANARRTDARRIDARRTDANAGRIDANAGRIDARGVFAGACCGEVARRVPLTVLLPPARVRQQV
ncbi:MAG: hypothetical protein L7S63_09390 [Flavobacteriales bacterium]|nr:hypothetical protein [Flavobacteriales bacterium]